MDINEIKKIAKYCDEVLDLRHAELSDEYFYQSLPLCIIDAIYSIRARYESTKLVIKRYCDYFGLQRIRTNKLDIPPIEVQESVKAFLQKIYNLGINKFTNEIFCNKQKTVGGILKSEAVFQFALILEKYETSYLQDISQIINDINFDKESRNIPGIGEAVIPYFFMLSGSENLIKPDRMVLGFLKDILGRGIHPLEAQKNLLEVNNILKSKYPHITPRLLDHTIWKYQRGKN